MAEALGRLTLFSSMRGRISRADELLTAFLELERALHQFAVAFASAAMATTFSGEPLLN